MLTRRNLILGAPALIAASRLEFGIPREWQVSFPPDLSPVVRTYIPRVTWNLLYA